MNAPYQLLKVKKAENTCIALLENGRLIEYYQEDAQRDSIVGSICEGRVCEDRRKAQWLSSAQRGGKLSQNLRKRFSDEWSGDSGAG